MKDILNNSHDWYGASHKDGIVLEASPKKEWNVMLMAQISHGLHIVPTNTLTLRAFCGVDWVGDAIHLKSTIYAISFL